MRCRGPFAPACGRFARPSPLSGASSASGHASSRATWRGHARPLEFAPPESDAPAEAPRDVESGATVRRIEPGTRKTTNAPTPTPDRRPIMAMPNAKTPTTWDGPDRAPVALKLACACAISVAILAGVGAGFSTPTSYALARAQDVPVGVRDPAQADRGRDHSRRGRRGRRARGSGGVGADGSRPGLTAEGSRTLPSPRGGVHRAGGLRAAGVRCYFNIPSIASTRSLVCCPIENARCRSANARAACRCGPSAARVAISEP